MSLGEALEDPFLELMEDGSRGSNDNAEKPMPNLKRARGDGDRLNRKHIKVDAPTMQLSGLLLTCFVCKRTTHDIAGPIPGNLWGNGLPAFCRKHPITIAKHPNSCYII